MILYPVCPQDKHAEDNPDNLLPSSHQTAALYCTRSSGFVKKKQYFFFIFMDRYIVCTDLIFQADFLTAFCFFPFTVILPSSIIRSASRLEHMPASLKYLFILIFRPLFYYIFFVHLINGEILMEFFWNFFQRAGMGNRLVFCQILLYDIE